VGEYFKPWRRKVGVVTLVAACVIMGAWVRSIGKSEQLHWWTKDASHEMVSTWGHLIWMSNFPSDPSTRTLPRWLSSPIPNKQIHAYVPGAGFTWGGGTIGVGEFELRGSAGLYKRYTIVIPYWSIAIPLTMLSAWLLLATSHRAAKQSSVIVGAEAT
jgi:hypothetical protein